MKTKDKKWLSANALSEQTHSERRHIQRWMESEGVPTKQAGGRILFEKTAAVAAIRQHQRKPDGNEGEPLDVQKLLDTALHLSKRNELFRKQIAILSDGAGEVIAQITTNKMGLSEPQQLALLELVNAPCKKAWALVPKEERDAVNAEGKEGAR